MYFQTALHNGSPEFMLVVFLLLGSLVAHLRVRGSGIAQHPYSNPHDGGELASDLPPEAIGRAQFEPLIVPRRAGRLR